MNDWIKEWYKWMFSTNPSVTFDSDGSLNQKYQPNSKVYFLSEEYGHVNNNRSITIKSRPLIFPALYSLAIAYSAVDANKFNDAADRYIAGAGMDTSYIFLDGKPIKPLFVRTGLFPLRTYDFNTILGDYRDGKGVAISQGNWGFLNPLSPGHHKLEFFGGSRNYAAGATYNINVMPNG